VKADSTKRSAWDQKKLEAVLREMHAGKRPPPPSCIIHQHRQRHEPHEKVKDLSFVYFVLFVVTRTWQFWSEMEPSINDFCDLYAAVERWGG